MFLLFICLVVLLNFTLCNNINGGSNEIPNQHTLQCDQNGQYDGGQYGGGNYDSGQYGGAFQKGWKDDIFNPAKASSRSRRAVSSETSRLWPYGIIPYKIEPGIPEDIVRTLKGAMDHWSRETCIRFTRRSEEADYVSFYNGINCCSWVGKVGGKQTVSIGNRCSTFGVLIHELGHVIGFWHEHSRPDRDNYIKVISENLVLGSVRNFEKLPNSKVNSFGKLYDYESIMHYGPRHFSSNWKNTIETRLIAAQEFIGQRDSLSMGDIEQARILYECPKDSSACSSMVKDSFGRLSSPGYPRNYLPSLDCITIIQPDMVGYVLVAHILDIDMPQTTACGEDQIEIRDGPYHDSPLVTRICGNSHSDAIISGSGTLFIRFRSDLLGSGRGYLLEFETEDLDECVTDNGGCSHFCRNTLGGFYCFCPKGWTLSVQGNYCIDPGISGSCSGLLTEESGVLASMGYPSGYMGGLSCYWMIYPPLAKQIQLTFHDFDLESGGGGPGCLYDFLEISPGGSLQPVRYCGQALPGTMTVNSTSISLRFRSDAISAGRGFLATYTTLADNGEPKCSKTFNTVNGEISYKRQNVACDLWTYIITLPSSFQLSYKYRGDMQGKASVYSTKLLSTYHGHTSASAAKTTASTLKIEVDSDKSSDNFRLSWKSKDKGVCGGFHRVPRTPGNIFSHHTFNETVLAPHQTCIWHFTSKHRIRLTFLTFDLVAEQFASRDSSYIKRKKSSARRKARLSSHKCGMNYLEVVDGGKKVGRFCNDRKLSSFTSKTSNVKLKLVTKSDVPGKGFHIKFSRLT